MIIMRDVDFSKIEISANGRNVKYNGVCLDKCGISSLIHDVNFVLKRHCFPLWSDIYWFDSTKKELVDYLKQFLSEVAN